MSTYMTLKEYAATLKVGDEVTVEYCSISGSRQTKEKILKITKSGTIYLRSKNCKDALRFRKNGHWINIDLDTSICSVCKKPQEYETKYCPECGAKMENNGDDDDE